VGGEPLDTQRHRMGREVKAITYHGLWVRQAQDHWEAEVIVDV
jgi:SHS2 domain-containing protein